MYEVSQSLPETGGSLFRIFGLSFFIQDGCQSRHHTSSSFWYNEVKNTWYVHVWWRGVAISTLRSRIMRSGRWKLKCPPPWDVASMRNRLLRVSLRFSRNFLSSFSATISAAFPRGLLIMGTVPTNTKYILYRPFEHIMTHKNLQRCVRKMYEGCSGQAAFMFFIINFHVSTIRVPPHTTNVYTCKSKPLF